MEKPFQAPGKPASRIRGSTTGGPAQGLKRLSQGAAARPAQHLSTDMPNRSRRRHAPAPILRVFWQWPDFPVGDLRKGANEKKQPRRREEREEYKCKQFLLSILRVPRVFAVEKNPRLPRRKERKKSSHPPRYQRNTNLRSYVSKKESSEISED